MRMRRNARRAVAGVALAAGWLIVSPASPGAAPAAAARPEPADNSYCYVCHATYDGEKLTAVHQRVGVGCEQCHGTSIKHSGDEDGLTPPEKMYARSKVNAFCMTCHEKAKLVKDEAHDDFFKTPTADDACSTCHAQKHRLKVRTRIWDKQTGKLLKDDGVRMMQKDSPATEGAVRKAKP